MSITNCPYCAIKEAKEDIRITADYVEDGKCPDCGAYIDAGQHYVKVNGYFNIYQGAIRLLWMMVTRFDNVLDACGIDLKDYFDDDVNITFNSSEIIDALFTPWAGGTTKSNFAKAIGIGAVDNHVFVLQEEEDEE